MTFANDAWLDAEYRRLAGVDAPPVVATPKAKKKPRFQKPESLLKFEAEQREARKACGGTVPALLHICVSSHSELSVSVRCVKTTPRNECCGLQK
jgi:hypothetical protein